MTIKKPIKTGGAPEAPASSSPAPVGGATIADRFKLDMADPNVGKPAAGTGTVVTLIAGLIALAVAGILTFIIYQHWEFLRGA